MDKIKFSCDVAVKDAADIPLTVSVLLNGEEYYAPTPVNGDLKVEFEFPDEEDKEWKLDLVVSGKDDSHTTIDENGNVSQSTELMFSNFEIDTVSLDPIILVNSLPYTHNFNGTSETVTEKFYDTAGCNGTITLEFTTPFYLWLLENM
jgi:hypothetical protein